MSARSMPTTASNRPATTNAVADAPRRARSILARQSPAAVQPIAPSAERSAKRTPTWPMSAFTAGSANRTVRRADATGMRGDVLVRVLHEDLVRHEHIARAKEVTDEHDGDVRAEQRGFRRGVLDAHAGAT